MYFKEFDIRWSDIDANRHLANSAYVNFMSHTRMSYLTERGLDQEQLVRHQLGPVVFYEHIYYFREAFPGKPVRVSLELAGMSEDGMFFEFHHNFYDASGRNFAHCEMMGAWIDMKSRKLTTLPERFLSLLSELPRTGNFRVLTREDTRRYGKKPEDLGS